VPQVSKPAGRNQEEPTWKSAARQVWKPALPKVGAFAPNIYETPGCSHEVPSGHLTESMSVWEVWGQGTAIFTIKWAAAVVLFLNTVATFGQPNATGINHCVIAGVSYTNIFDVHSDSSGGLAILYKVGGLHARRSDLSNDFLQSWGIGPPWASGLQTGISTNPISRAWISALETGLSPKRFPAYFDTNSRQSTVLEQMLSPKVREYIGRHGEVKELLADAFRAATTNRATRICYFYTENLTIAPAFHSFTPLNNNFEISIRESLWPVDELAVLYFELINSQRDDKILAIGDQASLGRIGRQDYVDAVAKEEFHAHSKTQAFVNQLQLSKQEMADSWAVHNFGGPPTDYKTLMSNSAGSYFGHYEAQYDAMRPPASPAPPVRTTGGLPQVQGSNTCVIGGATYTNIFDVHAGPSDGVVILYKGGGLSAHRRDLANDFLQSWGISTNRLDWADISESGITGFIKTLSPKVREFIGRHEEVNQLLTDVIADQANPHHSLRLYYFYTEDLASAPAYYYWMGPNQLGIAVGENQKPVDELIEIIFELIASERDHRWLEIWRETALGRVGRRDFAFAMIQEEFPAYPKTRAFLNRLRLSDQEMAESIYFQHFAQAPQDLGGFMSHMQEASMKGRDLFKEFETTYDASFGDGHGPKPAAGKTE
jgi:hypothetical protein